MSLLVQESEYHSWSKVLTCGVLECRAVEEREELVHIDLVALGNGAESLREGGEIARELRADAGVGEESALLQEFLVHLVGGSCAEAELCNECFRVEAARTVESFRCSERNASFVIEVSDHGIGEHGGFLFQTVEHHGGHDAVLNANPNVVSLAENRPYEQGLRHR